jgi:hypothetical protein
VQLIWPQPQIQKRQKWFERSICRVCDMQHRDRYRLCVSFFAPARDTTAVLLSVIKKYRTDRMTLQHPYSVRSKSTGQTERHYSTLTQCDQKVPDRLNDTTAPLLSAIKKYRTDWTTLQHPYSVRSKSIGQTERHYSSFTQCHQKVPDRLNDTTAFLLSAIQKYRTDWTTLQQSYAVPSESAGQTERHYSTLTQCVPKVPGRLNDTTAVFSVPSESVGQTEQSCKGNITLTSQSVATQDVLSVSGDHCHACTPLVCKLVNYELCET